MGDLRRLCGILRGRTGGDRTRDPNIKSVVLYQLSYSPESKFPYYTIFPRPIAKRWVLPLAR